MQAYTYVAVWIALSGAVIMYNKYLLAYRGFPYPITLTMWCALFGWLLGCCWCGSSASLQWQMPAGRPGGAIAAVVIAAALRRAVGPRAFRAAAASYPCTALLAVPHSFLHALCPATPQLAGTCSSVLRWPLGW